VTCAATQHSAILCPCSYSSTRLPSVCGIDHRCCQSWIRSRTSEHREFACRAMCVSGTNGEGSVIGKTVFWISRGKAIGCATRAYLGEALLWAHRAEQMAKAHLRCASMYFYQSCSFTIAAKLWACYHNCYNLTWFQTWLNKGLGLRMKHNLQLVPHESSWTCCNARRPNLKSVHIQNQFTNAFDSEPFFLFVNQFTWRTRIRNWFFEWLVKRFTIMNLFCILEPFQKWFTNCAPRHQLLPTDSWTVFVNPFVCGLLFYKGFTIVVIFHGLIFFSVRLCKRPKFVNQFWAHFPRAWTEFSRLALRAAFDCSCGMFQPKTTHLELSRCQMSHFPTCCFALSITWQSSFGKCAFMISQHDWRTNHSQSVECCESNEQQGFAETKKAREPFFWKNLSRNACWGWLDLWQLTMVKQWSKNATCSKQMHHWIKFESTWSTAPS